MPPRKRRQVTAPTLEDYGGKKKPAMLGWCTVQGKHTGQKNCPRETETLICSCPCHSKEFTVKGIKVPKKRGRKRKRVEKTTV